MSIENSLRAPRGGTFAHYWDQPAAGERFKRYCIGDAASPMRGQNLLGSAQLATLSQMHVSRACIRAAIVSRANDNVAANRTICAPAARGRNTTPCLTERYVDFMHFTVNNALRCISAPDNPIDADMVFGLINNESAFMGFVHSTRGVGLMQMTTIAGREIYNVGHGGNEHLREMMGRPSKRGFCDPFKRLIRPVTGNSLDTCSFVGLEDGMARNVIGGIGLLSYYQKAAKDMLANRGVPRGHPRFHDMAELFAEIGYNAGMSQAEIVFDKIGARNLVRQSDFAGVIRGAAQRYIKNTYLNDIANSRSQIANLPRNCWEAP